MNNSIQYFTEKGIPQLEKIKINFMENPALFDKYVESKENGKGTEKCSIFRRPISWKRQ